MIWKLRNRSVSLSRSGLIMGVLNVTPDSFSDGGEFVDEEAAFRHADGWSQEGAAILDVGGESSRPGSEPVALEEELRRVIPVMKRIRARFPDLLFRSTRIRRKRLARRWRRVQISSMTSRR